MDNKNSFVNRYSSEDFPPALAGHTVSESRGGVDFCKASCHEYSAPKAGDIPGWSTVEHSLHSY